MNRRRFYSFLFFVATIAVLAVFALNKINLGESKQLFKISHPVITIGSKETLHFYKNGFALSGRATRFFDANGKEVTPPLPENLINGNEADIVINKSSYNYMLINKKYLLKTSELPFKQVHAIEGSKGFGFKEFKDFILLLEVDAKQTLVPYILKKDENTKFKLEDTEGLYYLDSDYDESTCSLSIMSVSLDASFPSTRVFHFVDINNLYGILSLEDEMFYQIYRLPSHVILVGIHQLICYNVNGEIQWKQDIKFGTSCQSVALENGVVFYFDKDVLQNSNSLFVDMKGKQKWLDLPKHILSLKPYKNGAVALQNGNKVILIGDKGDVTHTYEVNPDNIELYWNPYNPDYIYLLNSRRVIEIYSMKQEDTNK